MTYYHSRYGSSGRKRKSPVKKVIYIILLLLIVAALAVGYHLYNVILKPNIWIAEGESTEFYIHTGSTFDDVKESLYSHGLIVNRKNFEWWAKRKNLQAHINPGRYILSAQMSNNELINLLRSGGQVPLKFVLNNVRTKEELALKVAAQLEADSAAVMHLLNDSVYLAPMGFKPVNVLVMFIPNTYEFYWNTTAESFFIRMYKEYKNFWNADRLQKAEETGLSPVEVSILASIVDKETTRNDEKANIAAVYLNRLKYSWRLQADPTVVYAWGDFSIRRVLNIHKQIDSPFNTYKYYGLPPGPICVPSIAGIDAVLKNEQNNYMFFCAKDDFSGYHVFANTHAQHTINANKYRKALDDLNIKN